MRILYIGSVCNLTTYETILKKIKQKPSIAPLVFENALLDGFAENQVDVDIYSFPAIPPFPQTKKLWWGEEKDKLHSRYLAKWIPTINIPIIKQVFRNISFKRRLKKWVKQNPDGKLLLYGIPQLISKSAICCCKKYNIPCFSIVTDLPRDTYIHDSKNGIKPLLKRIYLNSSIKWQDKFSGYIYLTDAMKNIISNKAPYIVVEGIVNANGVHCSSLEEKAYPKAVMYAGGLEEKYGIDNLINAMIDLNDSTIELWLFGRGGMVKKIEKYAENYNWIKYYGNRGRDEILAYERKASLLVNPRSLDEEFTKYSFPSKTMEYLASGTPVLTTKLEGIPSEYYPYLFLLENNTPKTIADAITKIFQYEEKKLHDFGIAAYNFVINEKSSRVQAKKILKFIENWHGVAE